MALLEVQNVYRQYRAQEHPAVNGISLRVEAGELLSLVGESGSGKTTLLKLIAGLEERDAGEIHLNGYSVTGPSQNLVPGHPDVKVIFQDFRLSPNINVSDNISYALRTFRKDYQQARTTELLEICKLSHVRHKLPRELSGGEQQRVALARALADEPVLLLLDEPFSNTDVLLKFRLKNEIREIIKSQGVTAIFVTHDTADALSMADRVAVMQRGQIRQVDNPQRVYQHPVDPYVAQLFGNANIMQADVLAEFTGVHLPAEARNPDAWLCIRAEDIHLVPAAGSQLSGEVIRINYLGSHLEAEVRVPELGDLIVRAETEAVRTGERVFLQITPNRIHVFPDGRPVQ